MTIIAMIKAIKSGDQNAKLEIIKKFNPVLRKYAYYLSKEGAYSDLVVDFLDLLRTMNLDKIVDTSDGSMVKYIRRCINNCFNKRMAKLIKEKAEITFSELDDDEKNFVQSIKADNDGCDNFRLMLEDDFLLPQDAELISLIYLYGYSVNEIARMKRVSRQAVNQRKRRVLEKLRNTYSENSKGE